MIPSQPGRPGDTRSQVLDATLDALADCGLSGLSLEDVAQRAGVSRQTLYRHFGNRRGLIEAAVVREEEAFLALLGEAVTGTATARDTLSTGIRLLLEWAAGHPLLGRLLAEDPDVLVPLLTTGDGPVLAVARPAVQVLLAEHAGPTLDVDTTADVVTRLLVSYAVNPPEGEPAEVADRITAVLIEGIG